VQIPLDYYRILGLPIQANADQLAQAHRDRGLQLPRREFSAAAIEARKQLIDEAYRVCLTAIAAATTTANFSPTPTPSIWPQSPCPRGAFLAWR
jgi:hypothetical protein